MKTLMLALGLAITANSGIAQTDTHKHDMSQHRMAMQPVTRHEVNGVLKAVNAKTGKVQIAHEAIADLGWPPMTMWFALRDPLPKDLMIGDSVRFEMVQGDKNQWMIITIKLK